MNEKFTTLFTEAERDCILNWSPNQKIILEKFAELIVLESAKALCDSRFRSASNDSKLLVGQGVIFDYFGL
jgi:hypothetical protein